MDPFCCVGQIGTKLGLGTNTGSTLSSQTLATLGQLLKGKRPRLDLMSVYAGVVGDARIGIVTGSDLTDRDQVPTASSAALVWLRQRVSTNRPSSAPICDMSLAALTQAGNPAAQDAAERLKRVEAALASLE